MPEAPRRIDVPEEGFFLIRLVRRGPWIGAAIVRHAGSWRAQIDGRWCGDAHADPAVAPGVMRVWTSGKRVSQTEFQYRVGVAVWAAKHAPLHPAANPRDRIDPNAIPSIF